MIRLILTDLDGTLINAKNEVPAEFVPVYRKLRQKGIYLGIATGRSFASIKRDFPEFAMETAIICEGGGVTILNGKMIDSHPIEKGQVLRVLRTCMDIDRIFPTLCKPDISYVPQAMVKKHYDQIVKYYPAYTIENDLATQTDNVVKITCFDELGSEINSYPALRKYENELEVRPSAADWVDVCRKGVNKGLGVTALQKALKITQEESMAFGDFLNDIELLESVKYSYAMANAHPKIKSLCLNSCESNEHNGVMKTIIREFDL